VSARSIRSARLVLFGIVGFDSGDCCGLIKRLHFAPAAQPSDSLCLRMPLTSNGASRWTFLSRVFNRLPSMLKWLPCPVSLSKFNFSKALPAVGKRLVVCRIAIHWSL